MQTQRKAEESGANWGMKFWQIIAAGCAVLTVLGCGVLILGVFWTGAAVTWFVREGVGAVSPVPHAREFLVALAEDDLETAVALTTMNTDPDGLRARLPSRLLQIDRVDSLTDFYSAANGYGHVEYRVTLDDGASVQVRLTMRVDDSEWRVSSASLLTDES